MLIATPVFFLSYRNEDLAVMTSVLYLILAFMAVYKICKLYLNSRASLLCCFVLFMYPLIFGLSRQLLPTACLLSIVSLSMLLLLKCSYFKNLRYSLLLGMSLGVGMLTKITYLSFMAGPFIYVVLKSCLIPFLNHDKNEYVDKKNLQLSRRVRLNFLYCLIIAIGLSIIWYVPNLKANINLIADLTYGEGALRCSRGSLFSLEGLLFYPHEVMNYGISFIFSLLFIIAAIRFFRAKKYKDIKVIILLWMLAPIFLYSIFLAKDVRFIVPIFTPIAIITGVGIYEIKSKISRRISVAIIIVVGILQFIAYSFKIPLMSQLAPKSVIWDRVVFFDPVPYTCYRTLPEHVEWGVMDSLLFIKSHMERENIKESSIVLLADHKAYNPNTLFYYCDKEKFRCRILSIHDAEDDYFMIRQEYDYVLYKDNEASDIPVYMSRIEKAIKYIKANPDEFRLIYKNRLPDGSNILIYKHG